ncbi:hypothetical protein KAR34_14055 [bacterium]|nr:hypothetical protein [bacterium]
MLVKPYAWSKTIAVILSRSIPPFEAALEGFQENTLRKVRKFNMQGDAEQGRRIIQSLSVQNIDLLVTIGSEATRKAAEYENSIPAVYTMVMAKTEFTERRAAGVLMQVELREQIKNTKKLLAYSDLSHAETIGVIYNPYYSSSEIKQGREIVQDLGMRLIPIAVTNNNEITDALNKLTKDKIGILWSVLDKTVGNQAVIKLLIQHSHTEKIPFVALSRHHVKAGVLMAFSADYKDVGAQTAELAEKMLRSRETQPLEYPRHIILYVNPKIMEILKIKKMPRMEGIQVIEE